MRLKILLPFFLSAWLLTGCRTSYYTAEQLAKVERGMTMQEIQAIFGKPNYRGFDEHSETWTYLKATLIGWAVVRIEFKDNRVTAMQNYLEPTYSNNQPNQPAPSDGGRRNDGKSRILIGSDGKHYIKMGNILVTPEGKHIILH